MSIDVKHDAPRGSTTVRALTNQHGDVGVSFLHFYETHQEHQAIRAHVDRAAVGPVLKPWAAFALGLQLILASFVCAIHRLYRYAKPV